MAPMATPVHGSNIKSASSPKSAYAEEWGWPFVTPLYPTATFIISPHCCHFLSTCFPPLVLFRQSSHLSCGLPCFLTSFRLLVSVSNLYGNLSSFILTMCSAHFIRLFWISLVFSKPHHFCLIIRPCFLNSSVHSSSAPCHSSRCSATTTRSSAYIIFLRASVVLIFLLISSITKDEQQWAMLSLPQIQIRLWTTRGTAQLLSHVLLESSWSIVLHLLGRTCRIWET